MQSLTVSGQQLEYEFLGAGPLVVLVNNPVVPLPNQRLMADPLVKAGRRVLLFENHGPDSSSLAEFTDALAGLLDALELRSVDLYGWSQGAVMIQRLAVIRPDLVGRMVLLGTTWRLSAFFRTFLQAYADSFALDGAAGENMRTALMRLAQMTPAMIASDAVQSAADAMPSTPVETQRRVFGGGNALEELSIDDLAAVTAPALVVGFERDMLLPAALSREVAEAIKGARYIEIAEATHLGPFTHTRQIMDVVLPFLAENAVLVK